MLSVTNEDELLKAYDRLQHYGIRVAKFEEPDRNNEITAIATEPLPADSKLRRKFSCYKLLNLDAAASVIEAEEPQQTEEPTELPECSLCEGRGEVDDPAPCGRCRVKGCRSMTCPKCNGARTEGVTNE